MPKPLTIVPAVHRATHRIGLYLSGLTDEGLSQGEAHILVQLAESGPAPIADLYRGLAHKRSTLTSILDRLADRGLVTRAVGKKDRRTFVITPTAAGRRIGSHLHTQVAALEAVVARRVPAGAVRALTLVLSALEDEAHTRATRRRR